MCFFAFSLFVKLHDIVIGHSADWTLFASARTFNTSCYMPTRNKGRIAISLVTQFAHLSVSSACSKRLRNLRYPMVLLLLLLNRLTFVFFFFKHKFISCSSYLAILGICIDVNLVVSICPSALCNVLYPLVNYWHVFQVVDVATFDHEDCASDLQNIANFQRMEIALLTFSAKS